MLHSETLRRIIHASRSSKAYNTCRKRDVVNDMSISPSSRAHDPHVKEDSLPRNWRIRFLPDPQLGKPGDNVLPAFDVRPQESTSLATIFGEHATRVGGRVV